MLCNATVKRLAKFVPGLVQKSIYYTSQCCGSESRCFVRVPKQGTDPDPSRIITQYDLGVNLNRSDPSSVFVSGFSLMVGSESGFSSKVRFGSGFFQVSDPDPDDFKEFYSIILDNFNPYPRPWYIMVQISMQTLTIKTFTIIKTWAKYQRKTFIIRCKT